MTEEEPTTSHMETSSTAASAAPDSAPNGAAPMPEITHDVTGVDVAELEARVADLERQLTREREAATDYMNRWQRAQADFTNFKRRAQQDQEQLQRTFAIEAARLILPALDSFERAFGTLPSSLRSYTWISGIALVEQQLAQALAMVGIQPIAVEPGHAFDPAKHEAIGEVDSSEHPAGHVAAVVQRGYQVESLVLRPALVQIAKAAETATTSHSPPGGDVGAPPAAPSGAGSEDPKPSAS